MECIIKLHLFRIISVTLGQFFWTQMLLHHIALIGIIFEFIFG